MNHIVGCILGLFLTVSTSCFILLRLFLSLFRLHPSADHLMDKSIRTPRTPHSYTHTSRTVRVTPCTHSRRSLAFSATSSHQCTSLTSLLFAASSFSLSSSFFFLFLVSFSISSISSSSSSFPTSLTYSIDTRVQSKERQRERKRGGKREILSGRSVMPTSSLSTRASPIDQSRGVHWRPSLFCRVLPLSLRRAPLESIDSIHDRMDRDRAA